MKVRNKLNRIQKNYISLEGVEVDGIVPFKAIEDMLSIVGCQDGSRLDQYPKKIMVGNNINIESGLCSTMDKIIFVHAGNSISAKTPILGVGPSKSLFIDDDIEMFRFGGSTFSVVKCTNCLTEIRSLCTVYG